MEEHNALPMRQKKKVRPGAVIFVAVAVAATLGLAYWQWTRFRSGTGTFQNLGYALQWPAFGAFIIYAYRRYIQLENEYAETGVSPGEREKLEREEKGEITEIDEDFLPQRRQLDVEEFNKLNQPRRRQAREE